MTEYVGWCCICGKQIKHHHKYCDKHYPNKNEYKQRIKRLTESNQKLRRRVWDLERQLRQSKRDRKKARRIEE